MITHDVDVLVAGLGPVGSVAALYLARQGVKVAAVEANRESATDLRASTFHAPTIEMLDRLGATDVLFNYGLKAPIYQFRDRKSGETFAFDLGELADVTRFPYRIQCEQHLVTDEVVSKLALLPDAAVHYHSRLLFIEQDDAGVTAYVDTGTAVEKFRARYMIAADGANSVARKVLDLGFPGFTYDQKFLCLSTEYPIEKAFDNLSYVNYLSDPEEWMVLLKVPTLWRVLVPAAESRTDADLLSDENKNTVFRNMLGSDVRVETKHRTIYRVHQRVCERFRVGKVALIGDAVHLNSPMGGFGMNSGIHDGINLGEKLVQILQHGASDDLLGLYERQRRTVTENFVQAQTIENTKLMNEGWGAARADRRTAMSSLMTNAAARRAFMLKQSMFTSLDEAAAVS